MIGYYVVRGHDHARLINLSHSEKLAYWSWMELAMEDEANTYKAMTGAR